MPFCPRSEGLGARNHAEYRSGTSPIPLGPCLYPGVDGRSHLGMKRSTFYKLILLSGFTFMLGFSYNYHLPKLESWLLVEAERLSREKLPVKIFAQRLSFHLLPLGVVLEEVKVLAQPPADKYLAPAR